MKNIQIVSRLVARENNYDADLVEDVNGFFWKNVRKALSSMEYTSVSVKHLCTLTVSKRKVNYIIKKLIGKIRNTRKSTRFKESTKALLLEVNYDKLRKALKQRNILANQYYENYTKRISRICETPPNDSIECSSNSGSYDQPSEERVRNVEGGRATGDSEEKIDLCNMSV